MLWLRVSSRPSKWSGFTARPLQIKSKLSFRYLNGSKADIIVAGDTLHWDTKQQKSLREINIKTQRSLTNYLHQLGKSNVLFAGFVHITDHSHGYEDINLSISKQPCISKGSVIIEDDCQLGFDCEILSGKHIGKHSIVAARAVVTKSVPPYFIVGGNPAKVIKQYSFETKKW